MNLLTIIFSVFAIFTNLPATDANILVTESESFAKCATPPFDAEYKNSKAIFAGKVLSVRTDGDEKIFKFRVEKYWKGAVGKTVEVRYYETMRYQAWLEVGKRYLVYAKGGNSGNLSDGRCSWTKNYSDASTDLHKLGKGKLPR